MSGTGARATGGWRWRNVPLRLRVVLVATVILAVALLAGMWFFVRTVEQSEYRALTQSAEERIELVRTLLESGTATTPLPAARDSSLLVQVIDREGRVVAATANVSDMEAFVDIDEHPAVPGRTLQDRIVVERAGCKLFATSVNARGERYAIYVAAPVGAIRSTVDMLRSRALRATPFVVGISAVLLWFVAGRALRPVDVLRREVDAISAADLSRRVSAPAVDDEVGRLARTMNDLLGRLERSSEQQSRFVADASHELRSPLAYVRARLEVAQRADQRGDGVDWPATAGEVLRENQRMERLVSDLLLLARSDSGRLGGRREAVDVDGLIHGEVHTIRATARVPIDTRAVSAGQVTGDPDQLGRVVSNLLANAVRHATSRVSVALRPEHGEVVMHIDDDGPGVPAEQRDRVFERFARLDEARTRSSGGAGLGLSLSREIVSAHGGTITVEQAPLGGARFTVRLPEAL